MKKIIGLFLLIWAIGSAQVSAQSETNRLDSIMPVRGLAIAAPSAQKLDLFLKFVQEELAPSHFNLLILRVDWNYAYESHPELRDPTPLTREDVKKIVKVCRDNGIRIAPQINLLGHQSWAETTYALLREYPEFDETPHVDTKNYTGWPNSDGLYCKSYCPLHPEVHKIVFALVDELTDVFETQLFHAGMDEVFYIGHDSCVRCNTYRAIDLIPKDVFICDWHYERAEQTAVYFAMKGFDVATCPWRKPQIALQQVDDMIHFRQHSNPEMSRHFQGIIETVWSGADSFLEAYYNPTTYKQEVSDAVTVKKLIEKYKALENQ